jgi:DNA-3-methyladenine glycosylase I
MARLMEDKRVIRNAQKLPAILHDARRVQELVLEFGSFAAYLWSYAEAAPLPDDSRARAVADKMSRDLRVRGFKFTGPATCYGLMQDVGLVLVHDPHCQTGQDIMDDWQSGLAKTT